MTSRAPGDGRNLTLVKALTYLTGLAALLFVGSFLNWLLNPMRAMLEQQDVTEYHNTFETAPDSTRI